MMAIDTDQTAVFVSAPSPAMTLAEAMAAMLCHDLSSPLGTLIGGLELAEDEPGDSVEALHIAREAAARMVSRLRLLRVAWGGDCDSQSRTGLQELLQGLPPRVTVVMDRLQGRIFDGPLTRVLLNASLLAVEALPRGGTIELVGEVGGAGIDNVAVLLSGVNASWPANLSQALVEPLGWVSDNLRTVHGPVLGLLAIAADIQARLAMAPRVGGVTAQNCPPLLLTRLT